MKLWPCIGCSKRLSTKPHRFCRKCRKLIRLDEPPDMLDIPSKRECRRAIHAVVMLLGPGC